MMTVSLQMRQARAILRMGPHLAVHPQLYPSMRGEFSAMWLRMKLSLNPLVLRIQMYSSQRRRRKIGKQSLRRTKYMYVLFPIH